MTTTTGTLEALSKLHDATDTGYMTVIHELVHEVVMNVTGTYTEDEHHETLAKWRPGWGSRL